MAVRRWDELSPQVRRLLVAAGSVDAVLRAVALVDVRRRPADRVRGPKWVWATALSVVSSAGLLPLAWFVLGRRR
ncbi:hypothetical protein [Pseudonocardia sp. N23]|uniref:hypothetical protein n=1 Tax=Pseudonocardia sp. N23 TaxID=1987376 RepID=UPI000BFB45ED|nr:hypothetical protein [Pseudonocardia sp. N23]GAY13123.1 hypothetical protein TOK_2042 [Pseudonocardia sp. N23]